MFELFYPLGIFSTLVLPVSYANKIINTVKYVQSSLTFNKFPKCIGISGKMPADNSSYWEEIYKESKQNDQYFPVLIWQKYTFKSQTVYHSH